MTNLPPTLSPRQRLGRILLIGALAVIGFGVIQSPVEQILLKQGPLSSHLLSVSLTAILLYLAYRGGRVSLSILKGCTGIVAVFFGIAVIAVTSFVVLGQLSPQEKMSQNILHALLPLTGFFFSAWAILFSAAVKDFVQFQRSVAFFHEQERIKARPRHLS